MDTVNRVVVYKFFLFPLFSFFLVACGGDSSDSLDLAQLEQHKGRAYAPVISEVAVGDGDTIYLNKRSYGEVFEGLSTRLNFTAPTSGYALLLLTESTVDFSSIPSMGVGSLFFREFGGYRSVFYMEEDERYAIDLTVVAGESSGNFELELVEINRESLALTENEYLLELNFVGERHFEGGGRECDAYSQPVDSSIKYAEDYSDTVIFNFEDSYQRQLYANIGNEYGETSGSTLSFNREESFYTWNEAFNINAHSGTVAGSYYKKEIVPDIMGDLIGDDICARLTMYRVSNGLVTGAIIL